MRTRLAVSALALSGVLAVPATAAAPKKITNEGVGKVKLGATHASLREQGLVGALRPGCELGGPGTRSARLKPPLAGSVDYSLTNPREVRAITISGGARPRATASARRSRRSRRSSRTPRSTTASRTSACSPSSASPSATAGGSCSA
jgi:hypothetical protein